MSWYENIDWGELAGATSELIGSGVGEGIAAGKNADIQRLLEELRLSYANMPNNPLTPDPVGRSELGNVRVDPRYGSAENEALRRLMDLASSGGLSDADKAKLEQAKLSGLAVNRGMRGAGEDRLRRRGVYSSGAEIASDLAAQQAGVDTTYKGDVATAAAASDRALDALTRGGNLAYQLGSRDLSQKDLAASANDRVNQFNATRADQAQMFNNSALLAKLKAMGATDAQIAALWAKIAASAPAKGAGYGRQIGELGGALFDANKKSGGGSDPDEWNAWPGMTEDSNTYGGYKLDEEDDDLLGDFGLSDEDELPA